MTSGWQGTPVFQEVPPGAGFKTGDFVKETFGGGYRSKTLHWFYSLLRLKNVVI